MWICDGARNAGWARLCSSRGGVFFWKPRIVSKDSDMLELRRGKLPNRFHFHDGMHLNDEEAAFETLQADAILRSLELSRKYEEGNVVVDLTMLVVSMEAERKDLMGKPFVIVNNGFVVFASEEALEQHVSRGMTYNGEVPAVALDPAFCADIGIAVSEIVMKYDECFVLSGLSYAYVNVLKYCQDHRVLPENVAEELRDDLAGRFGCEFRVAMSTSFILARMLLRHSPALGVVQWSSSKLCDVIQMCSSQPINSLCIPKEIMQTLDTMGIRTFRDVIKNRAAISATFPASIVAYLFSGALGVDCGPQRSCYTVTRNLANSTMAVNEMAHALSEELCLELSKACGIVRHLRIAVSRGTRKSSHVVSLPYATRELSDLLPAVTAAITSMTANAEQPFAFISLKASLHPFVTKTSQKTLTKWVVPQHPVTSQTTPHVPRKPNFMEQFLGTSPAKRKKPAKPKTRKPVKSTSRQTTLT